MKKIVESYKRKLASEEGWVLKRGAKLRIALCYPNVYSIGMANLGFQAMYELFNNIPEVSCERVFLPDSSRGFSVEENSSSARQQAERRLLSIHATAPGTTSDEENLRAGSTNSRNTNARGRRCFLSSRNRQFASSTSSRSRFRLRLITSTWRACCK